MAVSRRLQRIVGTALCVGLAACASGGADTATGAPEAAGNRVSIQVDNDLVPPESITVWIVPETGSRQRLGNIAPGGSQTFTFLPAIRGMEHRLLADVAGGRDRESLPFDLAGVSRLEWDVSSSSVRVQR